MKICSKQVLDSLIEECKKSYLLQCYCRCNTGCISYRANVFYFEVCSEKVWDIKEFNILLFEDCEKKKGKDMADLLCRVLEIDIHLCSGQGYDNGSNMTGIYNDVQALIPQKNPQVLYLPCSADSLNLCGAMLLSPAQL